MKKSRSSTPRLVARCPGLAGIPGPARVDCEAGPRVAIAVGNTLETPLYDHPPVISISHELTMKDRSCPRNCAVAVISEYTSKYITYAYCTYPTFEYPVPLSQMIGAKRDMVV